MTHQPALADHYDSPWKDVLEHAFPEFMAFYFPAAHVEIDWTKGHEFKNTELRQVVRDAELGKRFADTLVQVTLKNGTQKWIYIHIEVQGERDTDFAQRMFTYNYRLYDRYHRPIASLAVLADQDAEWKPDHFGFEVLGCRHTLDFPVAKLLEYTIELDDLQANPNPFAIVTAAHLRTRQTRHDPEARYHAKRTLVWLLYRHGWDRQRILDLFAVLDWMMRLPEGLEQRLWQDIESIEGETKMRYVTSIERLATKRGVELGVQQGMQQGMQQGIQKGMQQGMQKGMQQGMQQGERNKAIAILTRHLTKRFGRLSDATRQRLDTATLDQLDTWADRILDADSLDAVFDEN